MRLLLIAPLLVPLTTAALGMVCHRWPRVQRLLGLLGAIALFASVLALLAAVRADGVLVCQVGGWPAPFGITLVADLFSALMLLLPGLMGVVVSLYAFRGVDARRAAFGFWPLVHVLLAGVSGSFLSGDLFNLYVSFEVMLMASFVLMALGGERGQLEGALKYVTLNLLSSALFLAGVGILYGVVGTLNLADLSVKLRADGLGDLRTALGLVFLAAFGIKAALFPFFFWLPASYHTPPAAVSALFAALLTKVGIYALVRVYSLLFGPVTGVVQVLLLGIAGVTMVIGVLGALAQGEFRRVLAFHSVSQVGYMLMGLALYTPLALAGCILFLLHHALAKSNLFLIGGWAEAHAGTGSLARLGGLSRRSVTVAILFLVSAFSLAGLPPLSGFLGKLVLVRAGLEAESWAIVATALAVSLLTLLSMTKIWSEAFWKAPPEPIPVRARRQGLLLPMLILSLLMVAMGCLPAPLLELARRSAEQLLDPDAYVRAVLGGGS